VVAHIAVPNRSVCAARSVSVVLNRYESPYATAPGPGFSPEAGALFCLLCGGRRLHSRQSPCQRVFGHRPGEDTISQNVPGVTASGILERRLSLSIEGKEAPRTIHEL
jgi:hypothetical protein